MDTASSFRIAIIGGGPGGLCAAIALRRGGFKNVTVYERDQNADARKQGYSFTLHAPEGGLGFIQKLGLYDEVEPHGFDVHMRILEASGSCLLEFSKKSTFNVTGEAARRIMRPGLRNILVGVCQREGINIVWNSKYVSYEEKDNSVILNFEKEPPVEVDLVIAADGSQSKIREQLIGDHPVYPGYSAIYSRVFPQDNPQLFQDPMVKESGALFTFPNKTFFFFHHKTKFADEIHWIMSFAIPEGELHKSCPDHQSAHKYALEAIKDWPGVPKVMVESTPVSGIDSLLEYKEREPLIVNPKTSRTCNSKSGRITMLGDAAHAMLPFQGAGGNNAMMDAWKLSDLLVSLIPLKQVTKQDLNKVLSTYEKEMASRGNNAVLESRSAANQFHATGVVSRTRRNLLYRALNWRINTYGPSKAVQWTVKSVLLGIGIGGLSLALSYFELVNFQNIVNLLGWK